MMMTMSRRIALICLLLMSGLAGCDKFARDDHLAVQKPGNEVAVSNLNLGVAYMQQNEFEKALEKLNNALAADPNYVPTNYTLGWLYQNLGKNEDAEFYFKKALSINATDPQALNYYGQFLCSTKRYDEGQALFQKAVANPLYDSPEIAITNAGTCALNHGKPDIAESFFRQALEKNPRVPAALLQLAQLSFDKGNYPDANEYLKRYLEISRHTPVSLWLGIQTADRLGDKNTVSSYALLLKNNYPDSREAEMLKQSGLK